MCHNYHVKNYPPHDIVFFFKSEPPPQLSARRACGMLGQAQVAAPVVAGAGVLQLILIGVVLDTRRIAVPGPPPPREPPDLGFVPADLLARVGAQEAASLIEDVVSATLVILIVKTSVIVTSIVWVLYCIQPFARITTPPPLPPTPRRVMPSGQKAPRSGR